MEYMFVKASVSPSKLAAEIFNNMSISVKIHTKGNNVYIDTPSDLDSSQQSTLSTIVENHTYSLLRNRQSSSYDVKEYSDDTKIKLVSEGCYLNRSGNTLSDPVCKTLYVYDGLNNLIEKKYYRYYEDGTEDNFKNITIDSFDDVTHFVVESS